MSARTESDSRRRIREMLAKGLTVRTIALSLGISTQAVYKHLAAIRSDEEASA